MGRLTYDGIMSVDFDDRVLAHLQIVMGNKLRRGETFLFSWRDDSSIGDGRTIVWMHPSASMVFKFFGSRPPAINRAWVEALMSTANSATGLRIVTEPSDRAPAVSE